jgi:lysophospholipase L1-like esterase
MRTALWILLLIASADAFAAKPLRLLALGDSYTIGEGVPEAERWPVQLVARLAADGVEFAPPRIVARTGWTTDELAAAISDARLDPPYDAVTLLIGVNNQYRGYPLDQYRREFDALLERALAFAGGRAERVFVLSIPDWGVTPFARASGRDPGRIARELDAHDAIARELARAHGVAFVDVTAASRAHGADAEMLAPDGLHPSGAMYRLWVDALLPVMLQRLRVGSEHTGH